MGALVFYRKGCVMYAYCDDPDHGDRHACRQARSCKKGRSAMSGRPGEYLAAWLLSHDQAFTVEDHKTCCAEQDLESRRSAREMVQQTPAGLDLICCEREGDRDVDADPGSEPEDFS